MLKNVKALRRLFRKRRRDVPVENKDASSELAKEIVASGLFSADWYKVAYDLGRDCDPEQHYISIGFQSRQPPNPHFYPQWYLDTYPDVAASGQDPVVHYVRHGDGEGRMPCPYFETAWYRRKYAADIGSGNALAHFLSHNTTSDPNAYFSASWYLTEYPDVREAGIDPLWHYINYGFCEGRNPSTCFNTMSYQHRYLHGRQDNPLSHYLNEGRQRGHSPQPGYAASGASEIRHFTSASELFEPFDPSIASNTAPPKAKVIAYYLPQFHAFSENDEWWGNGFTEWTNLPRGTPRFVGHYQPRVPRDLGFYDLMDQSVLPRQIEMARAAGIHGFCFYYYNFNGHRLLERPLENLLKDEAIDFPFCLMWANENWTRRWDGLEAEVLMKQEHALDDEEALIADLARHLSDKRYIRVGGRPILFIYRAGQIPEPKGTFARWRRRFRDEHDLEPLIFMAQTFGERDPAAFGLDGAIEFPPHKITDTAKSIPRRELEILDHSFTARVFPYSALVEDSLSQPSEPYPLIRTAFPSWDNDARRQGHGLTVTGSTPALYQRWLDGLIAHASANPIFGETFVCINAWNEWAEGAYLEPDIHFGGAYLNATARAIAGTKDQTHVLLVGHDAFPAGAQTLLLCLARALKQQFGCEVTFLLLGDGQLLRKYRELATTFLARTPEELVAALSSIRSKGITQAIVNSAASSRAVPCLHDHGISSLVLVHEMAEILKARDDVSDAQKMASIAHTVIFPAEAVQKSFEAATGVRPSQAIVRPQGLYKKIQAFDLTQRQEVRQSLGLPDDASVVINVGYGDTRKGIDLFTEVAKSMTAAASNIHFLWAGDLHPHSKEALERSGAERYVRFLGHRTDVDALLNAADVFFLSSREDPFPSAVLEALAAGLPVVAFKGAGGFENLLGHGFGELAEMGNIKAVSRAIDRALQPQMRTPNLRLQRRELIANEFSFEKYAHSLLQTIYPGTHPVSVVVPNYNYARYLPERLGSIFRQSLPVYEVVVLDDCSQDESIEVIEEFSKASNRDVRLIPNAFNSGSPFLQWRKGIENSSAELVWIAEADDVAEPQFLQHLAPLFEDPDLQFAFTDSSAIDDEGKQIWPNYKGYYLQAEAEGLTSDQLLSGPDFARKYLSERNLILNVSSVLWRRSALLAALSDCGNELRQYRLAGDWALYLEACRRGKVAYRAIPQNRHRRGTEGVTSTLALQTHVAEIERVHTRFNKIFGETSSIRARQKKYLKSLTEQFSTAES